MFGSTQISIEIHFTPKVGTTGDIEQRMIIPNGQTGLIDPANGFDIDLTKTQFIADYIYYDGDLMKRFADENADMNWTYTDYRLSKRGFTSTQIETQQIIPIGGAGRLVNKVICGLELSDMADRDESMLNVYQAYAPTIDGTMNNTLLTTNLVYNNNRLYPVDRTSPSVHFHDLISTEKNVPQVSRQEYSRGGAVCWTGAAVDDAGLSPNQTYNGMVQDNAANGYGLAGGFFWQGYRLNRNERVDSKGIELQIQYGSVVAGQNFVHRSYLEMIKNARLVKGVFSTDLA
jgi:hypothetical protein